ncbi:MAG: hypothetical protein QM479_06825 [Pseudomonadota bacterium]
MKVAILENNQPGFIKPMAAGLQKMLSKLEVQADIFPNGLAMLNSGLVYSLKNSLKNIAKSSINLIHPQYFLIQKNVSCSELKKFEAQIAHYDVLIVVCNIPDAFLANKLLLIEKIRTKLSIPIVLYQNYYLATRGNWSRKIFASRGFGLERYDWYLAASVVSEYPLNNETHPFSLIGHDLRDSALFTGQKKSFKVLLDFNQKGFETYRQLQIQALNETQIEYTQLSGHYSYHEINKLYRQHSVLFLSFRESFGLPIVENQLCGNYIFTPHKNWAPSHYINKSLYTAGEGELGSNFKVYDNELDKLKKLLRECKKQYPSKKIVTNFKLEYPDLYHGNLSELKKFIDKLASGEINSTTHSAHQVLNADIVG